MYPPPGKFKVPAPGILDYLSRVDELLIVVVNLLQALTRVTPEGKPVAFPAIIAERYEIPIAEVDSLTTSSIQYGAIVSWVIPSDRSGELSFVEMDADSLTNTRFKLEGGGKTLFEDVQLSSSLSLEFPHVRLAPGSTVKLSASSVAEGTQVTAYGDIVGKEIPR